MSKFFSALAVLAMATSTVLAAKPGVPSKEATIESHISKEGKQTHCFEACTINFSRELKVPFDYLDSLGTRIHESRKLPDPVGLATAAQSLAVAEQVAGKKAAVTSDQVLVEAIELAKLRNDANELKAIALLVTDKKVKGELEQLAEVASDNAPEPGETSKGIIGTLRVVNHSGECLRIFINGQYRGEVHEDRVGDIYVHDHSRVTHLDAYCLMGHLVKHAHVFGDQYGVVTWHIHP